MMNELTYENIIQQMLKAIPEANSIYQSHLEFFEMAPSDPELPRHPLFAELARLTIRICMNPSEFGEGDEILDRIFDFIEEAAKSHDDGVINLIPVTFLEILSRSDNPCFEKLVAKMGNETQIKLRETIIFWHQALESYEEQTGWAIPRGKE